MIENSIFQKYFLVDHLNLAHPLYASDEKIACVCLDDKFKINTWTGRRRYLLPKCDFSKFALEERAPRFEEFVVDLLIESARYNQNFYYTFADIYNHYNRYDIPFGHILVPSSGDMADKVSKYAILTNFLSIDKTDLLNDVAIICPPPEYLGVIAIANNTYSIGVINSRAICVLR